VLFSLLYITIGDVIQLDTEHLTRILHIYFKTEITVLHQTEAMLTA